MENRKRNVQIIVRVTEDERTLIEEKMRQIPTMNLSAYSRKMLIDGYIIVLDLQKVKAHTAQLQKIGGNLNQITKRINETGRIYDNDMDELKAHGRSLEIGASATPAIQGANEMRAWDQAKCNGGSGAFYGTGYPVPMLATKL